MNYQKYTYNGYNMYFIKTKRFKEIRIKFSFRRPIQKKDITISGFLSNMLIYSTESFKTQRLFFMEQQRLYNIGIGYDTYRRGNFIFNDFGLSMLNDKYTEDGNMEKCINLLLDTIFKPNISNKEFDHSSFKIIYAKEKEILDTIKENKVSYATIKTKKHMGRNTPYSYIMDGYIEDLNKITPSNLYKYYRKWLHSNSLDIFVAGDFDDEKMREVLTSNIPLKIEYKINDTKIIYEHVACRKNVKKVIETDDVNQAKLVIGCKIRGMTKFERQYTAFIYNIIFGSSPTSKLFTVIREKHSLCYSIGSSFTLSDNILFIKAGIDKKNSNKTIKLVKQLMLEMENEVIEQEKLENAKTILLEDIKTIEDSESALINECQTFELFDYEDESKAEIRINSITIDDIKAFAKKVTLDTVFLLQGGENNVDN